VSARNTGADFKAAAARPHVTYFLLVELGLTSGTIRLASTPHDVEYGGHVYTAAQGIGTIEPVSETSTTLEGLRFTLAGATSASLASFFTEPIQGRPVVLRLGIVREDGTVVYDPNIWSGALDVPQLVDGAQPVITVTAEHEMLAWQQPSGALFSHQEQQLIDPTDLFFEFAAEISERVLVWPSKEAFS
jgi:hypothetical protein